MFSNVGCPLLEIVTFLRTWELAKQDSLGEPPPPPKTTLCQLQDVKTGILRPCEPVNIFIQHVKPQTGAGEGEEARKGSGR